MTLRVDQGKGRKDRYVMLSLRLLDELRAYWKAMRPTLWLFPGDLIGQPITRCAVEMACQKAHRASGISKPITPRIRFVTHSPHTCLNPAPVCVPFNSCWGIAVWPLPPVT